LENLINWILYWVWRYLLYFYWYSHFNLF